MTKTEYWTHRNGQTAGPFGHDVIVDLGDPEVLVSHGKEWISFSDHPDFKKPETNGTYFISENGVTVGPLTGAEVISRVMPETLVSNEGAWISFQDHPDFKSSTTADQTVGGIFDKGMALAGGIGLLEPNPKKPGHQRPNPKGWIAILGCGVPVGCFGLLFLLALMIGVSAEQGSTTVRSPSVSGLDTGKSKEDRDRLSNLKSRREYYKNNYFIGQYLVEGTVVQGTTFFWNGQKRAGLLVVASSATCFVDGIRVGDIRELTTVIVEGPLEAHIPLYPGSTFKTVLGFSNEANVDGESFPFYVGLPENTEHIPEYLRILEEIESLQ